MQLTAVLVDQLALDYGLVITNTHQLRGGDINKAYRIETTTGPFFLKYNQYPHGYDMLQTEALGLQELAATKAIPVPITHGWGTCQNYHYLLLEDWSKQQAKADFWPSFGRALAKLHQQSAPQFGLSYSNYIASLHQSNETKQDWPTFYWNQRIEPLARAAVDARLLTKADSAAFDQLAKKLKLIFPTTSPALLHGDLWSGNYLISPNGQAGLIDPAIYYGHREMDLAMTKLFGGFSDAFYTAYDEFYPLDQHWEERIALCQLYPLLVHVHLFGAAYVPAVKGVLKAYL